MLLLISYQTSNECKANEINLDNKYKSIKFYRLYDECAFWEAICLKKLINRDNLNDDTFHKDGEGLDRKNN